MRVRFVCAALRYEQKKNRLATELRLNSKTRFKGACLLECGPSRGEKFMTAQWMCLFAGAIALSAVGFVCVAVIWLRKLRETVSTALTEAAGHQIRTSQRLSESIAQLQKQQDNYTHQINILAQAGIRLQHEMSNISNRLDNSQSESGRGGQTLH